MFFCQTNIQRSTRERPKSVQQDIENRMAQLFYKGVKPAALERSCSFSPSIRFVESSDLNSKGSNGVRNLICADHVNRTVYLSFFNITSVASLPLLFLFGVVGWTMYF